VRLGEAEVDRIAAYLGLEPRAFVESYAALTADRRSLTLGERPDGACIMLTPANECRVHAAKPLQCQGFPERWRFPGFERSCQARCET
jgi:Fe-S-cluster containining protein